MKIITVTANNLEKYRSSLLCFVKRYQKEEKNSFRWLFQIRRHHLNNQGTNIKLCIWDGKIIAIFAVKDYGTKDSLFILAPNYYYPNVGCKILEEMKTDLSVCYMKINYTETELIKMALNAGFASLAYSVEQDGTLYLWFGGGQWDKNDLSQNNNDCFPALDYST